MYLRLQNLYKVGSRDQVSIKSSEESISNSYHILEPIIEEEYIFDSTFNMFLDVRSIDLPKFSMAFNMRLMFAKTNNDGAQLYQDPMNHWVIESRTL